MFNEDEDQLQPHSAYPIDDLADPTPDTVSEPAQPSAPAQSSSMHPAVSDFLMKLQAAQEQTRKNQEATGLTSALVQLGHGIARAPGQADLSAVNASGKNDNAPVTNFQDQVSAEANDPSGTQAQRLRALYKPLFEKAGLKPETLDGLSPSEIKAYAEKPLEFIDKQKTLEAMNAAKVGERQDRMATNQANRQDKLDQQRSDAQAKAYTDYRNRYMSFRGSPAVQQASLGILNADKALPLLDAKPTSQNLNLLADEMGKIATGGVPGEHGVQALLPNNLYTKIAEMKAWATGHPNASTADVSEYLKNNREYINQIMSVSKKTLGEYHQNLFKGYKNRLSESDRKEAQDELDGGLPSSSPSAPPAPHPDAGAAVTWAKSNPNDPRAKTILDRVKSMSGGGM